MAAFFAALVTVCAVLVASCASPAPPPDGSLMVVPKSERKLGVEFGTFVGGSIGR